MPTLYTAEGIPYVIVMSVATVMYSRLGLSNADIALYTSWLYLPWVIKPFWSPIVDLFMTKRWWIVAMQWILAISFAGIAFTSIVGTGLAYVIFVTSLKYITATEATVLNTFEPLTAVVLGFLFMGLQLNWAEILGAVLILDTTVILAFDNQSASSQKKKE